MDWYSLRPSSSISVCYFTLANPAHYAVYIPLLLLCFCLFLFFLVLYSGFPSPCYARTCLHSSFCLLYVYTHWNSRWPMFDETGWFLFCTVSIPMPWAISVYMSWWNHVVWSILSVELPLSTKMQHEQSPCILSTSHHQWISIPAQKALHQYSPTWIPPFPQQRQPKAQEPIHHLLTSQQTILPGRLCQLQWQAIQPFVQHLYRTNESCF